ncbi:hypothetical protein WA026_013800, partial [Henosepilachna vigintioctopunctata]
KIFIDNTFSTHNCRNIWRLHYISFKTPYHPFEIDVRLPKKVPYAVPSLTWREFPRDVIAPFDQVAKTLRYPNRPSLWHGNHYHSNDSKTHNVSNFPSFIVARREIENVLTGLLIYD